MMPFFIVDSSVIRDMINGQKEATQVLEKLEKIPDKCVFTTISSVLRGIFISNENGNLNNLKRLLKITQVMPSSVQYTDEEELTKEIIELANKFTKFQEGREGEK